MSNKIDIFIGKKKRNSNLTDGNIKYLKTKIDLLNKIYNIIFKHLCHKKNINRNWDLLSNVKADLNLILPNYLNDFCLGTVNSTSLNSTSIELLRLVLIKSNLSEKDNTINNAKAYIVEVNKNSSYIKRQSENDLEKSLNELKFDATNKLSTDTYNTDTKKTSVITSVNNFIVDAASLPYTPVKKTSTCSTSSMFDDNRLNTLINSMYIHGFLNKVCLYRNISKEANVQVAGFYQLQSQTQTQIQPQTQLDFDNMINVNQILLDKSLKKNNNVLKESLICIQKNNQLKCAAINTSNNQLNQCNYCEKWIQERNMFRRVLKDLLITQDMNQMIELMNASTYLLPAAILNQQQYHLFFTALDEYKKSKSNQN
jgi:hypothetical protein